LETYKDYGSQNSQVGSELHLKNCPLQKQKVAAKSQGTVKLPFHTVVDLQHELPLYCTKNTVETIVFKTGMKPEHNWKPCENLF
jgi:hypothetical protein